MAKNEKGTPKSTKGASRYSHSGWAVKAGERFPGHASVSQFRLGKVSAHSGAKIVQVDASVLSTIKMREVEQIIHRVEKWAGSRQKAEDWFYSEPLPSFGDRTAESLVKTGKAEAVRDYLDSIALGGYE